MFDHRQTFKKNSSAYKKRQLLRTMFVVRAPAPLYICRFSNLPAEATVPAAPRFPGSELQCYLYEYRSQQRALRFHRRILFRRV